VTLIFPKTEDFLTLARELALPRPKSIVERSLWALTSRLKLQAIIIRNDEGGPYLMRVYLTPHKRIQDELVGESEQERWYPGVYLHYFFRGDSDRELHNHPWNWALSWILTGGYLEERRTADDRVLSNKRRTGRFNVLHGNTFHRVQLMEERCWTLFVAGKRKALPRERSWGFWDRATDAFEFWWDRELRVRKEHWDRRDPGCRPPGL
jgi:hypothetical protein